MLRVYDRILKSKDMSKDSEHLQCLHDRIEHQYGESHNVDFLIRFRDIIETIKQREKMFEGKIGEIYVNGIKVKSD